jgi:hypothetical protein
MQAAERNASSDVPLDDPEPGRAEKMIGPKQAPDDDTDARDAVEEAGEESFPASDPPASHRFD